MSWRSLCACVPACLLLLTAQCTKQNNSKVGAGGAATMGAGGGAGEPQTRGGSTSSPGEGGNTTQGGAGGGNSSAGSAIGGNTAAGSATGGAAGGGSATGGKSGLETACANLKFERDVQVASTSTDRVTWNDARCRPRSAALARVGGGYVRQFSYDVNGKPRVATGTGSNGHKGFGYTVNHVSNDAWIGQDKPGQFKPLFVGDHHLLYEYVFDVSDKLPVTLHWLFVTGRDNPLLAIHYDLSAVPAGLGADTRTPYGDIAWDGDENASSTVVSGVGWGDRYRFLTTSAPLTMDSTWTYAEKNVVPYAFVWTDKTDAEMGIVQTQTQEQHDGGGYWLYKNWGKTSENQTKDDGQIGNMPVTWNWTYQLNQYELCIEDPQCLKNTTSSHRLAWGANYGALGGKDTSGKYPAYGDDRQLSGHPYQSYSVFTVLGPHSASPVLKQAQQIEWSQAVSITPSIGTLVTSLPSGVGQTPNVTLAPPGYDARYSTFNLVADANRVKFVVRSPSGALTAPVLVVSEYAKASKPTVRVNGATLEHARDYFASLDTERGKLWLTFVAGWSGEQTIEIE